jgi:hypothetical protein
MIQINFLFNIVTSFWKHVPEEKITFKLGLSHYFWHDYPQKEPRYLQHLAVLAVKQ